VLVCHIRWHVPCLSWKCGPAGPLWVWQIWVQNICRHTEFCSESPFFYHRILRIPFTGVSSERATPTARRQQVGHGAVLKWVFTGHGSLLSDTMGQMGRESHF
jgi:hypothetical protein